MAEVTVEPTAGDENDDSWLYGESTGEQIIEKSDTATDKEPVKTTTEATTEEEKEQDEGDGNNDDSQFNDEHFADVGREDQEQNGDADSQENGESDSDDSDDVKVTIGEIKSGPQYASLNIKRGVGLVAPGSQEKPRSGTTGSKVTLEDLEGPGSINGVPALEFNIDTIEDKPWNKPGADISDYFNYGFNESTWSAYCERQRRMRVNEAGVGLHVGPTLRAPVPDLRRPPGVVRHDDGMSGAVSNNYQARENTIQVMTAERREYGRSGHGRDPPPPPPPPADYFGAPPADYYQPPPHAPYDDTWGHPEQTGWTPTEIKELTPGPMGPPPMGPPVMSAPLQPPHLAPHLLPAPPFAPPYRPHHPHHPHHPHDRDRDRDRDRDSRMRERDDRDRRDRDRRDDEDRDRDRERDRSRSIKPDRIREKSYRRERSRSRSRRHKSRSRSPRLRERSRDRDRSRDRENERIRDRNRSREREHSRDRERSVKPKTKDKDKDDEK